MNGNKTANHAILALAIISVLVIIAGVVVGAFHGDVAGLFAIATGAVGGIVAIVLKTFEQTGGE